MSVQRHDARGMAAEAASAWVTHNDGCEGYIVTGYVLAVEYLGGNGNYGLTWMTGDGRPPETDEEDYAGLAPHRMTGILRGVVDEYLAGGGEQD